MISVSKVLRGLRSLLEFLIFNITVESDHSVPTFPLRWQLSTLQAVQAGVIAMVLYWVFHTDLASEI